MTVIEKSPQSKALGAPEEGLASTHLSLEATKTEQIEHWLGIAQYNLTRADELSKNQESVDDAEQVRETANLAFGEIVRLTYQDVVRNVTQRLIIGKSSGIISSEIDDVVQNVYIKAYRALPTFDHRSEFRTWLYRIAANTTASANDSQRRRRNREDRSNFLDGARHHVISSDRSESPIWAAVHNLSRERIIEVLGKLPMKDRRILWQRAVLELPYEQIIEQDGLDSDPKVETRLKVRYHRALKKMRDILSKHNIHSIEDIEPTE